MRKSLTFLPVIAALAAGPAMAVDIHGHRGARGLLPENTLPAFREAIALGVDVLIHGHTHNQEITQGKTVIINPGEAGGWLSGVSRAVVLDTDTMGIEPLVLAEPTVAMERTTS